MTLRNKNLIILIPIIFILILAVVLTNFLVSFENKIFIEQSNKIKNSILVEQKNNIKSTINNIIVILNQKTESFMDIQQDILKKRTKNGINIIDNIYNKNKNLSEKKIFEKIKQNLNFVSIPDKSIYYFIYKMDGTCISVPANRKLEGKNLIDLKDIKGQYVIQNMIDIAKKGGGFNQWYYLNPKSHKIEKKIGYVTLYKPLNIFIGTAIYEQDILNYIKKFSSELLNNFKIEQGGYIYAYDYKGNTIAHIKKDLIGKNRWNKKIHGQFLIQQIIKAGQKDGGSFLTYNATINPNTKQSTHKISFMNKFKKLKWIIGTGFYTDEIYNDIKRSQDKLKFEFDKKLKNIIMSIIIITSLFIIFLWFILTKLSNKILDYKIKLENNNKELENLNSTLQKRVEEEVEKNRQKDQQVIEQSRLAQMGEMISMIAHQWRQPLNSISAASNTIILKSQMTKLDDATTIKLASNISNYTQHLSSTIDDFRDFFKESKVIDNISYEQLINNTLNIIEDSIVNQNIKIVQELHDSTIFKTYSNEVKQVLLNILKNAQDALKEVALGNVLLDKDIQNKQITIKSQDGVLTISDNGGGVPDEIIDKIFDPYFSTKSKNGTGLGLYMSKVIIEEHCKGSLTVSNDKDGAVFKIELGDITK